MCSTPTASSLQPRAAGDNYPPPAALPDPLWETPSLVHRGRLAGAARSLVFWVTLPAWGRGRRAPPQLFQSQRQMEETGCTFSGNTLQQWEEGCDPDLQSKELFLNCVNKSKEQGTVLYFSGEIKLIFLTIGHLDLSRWANTWLLSLSLWGAWYSEV